jgi:hypothetical protein
VSLAFVQQTNSVNVHVTNFQQIQSRRKTFFSHFDEQFVDIIVPKVAGQYKSSSLLLGNALDSQHHGSRLGAKCSKQKECRAMTPEYQGVSAQQNHGFT